MKAITAFLCAGVVLGSATSFSVGAYESDFPEKPIRIIVPSSAGGGADVTARLYAERMASFFNQPVFVENRPGASTMLGSRYVSNAEPDGYTLLVAANTLVTMPLLSEDAGYSIEDFTGLALLGQSGALLVTSRESTIESFSALLDAANERPSDITYASGGQGTTSHIPVELFSRSAGVELFHIPYRGISNAIPDVLANRVDLMMGTATSTGELIKSGDLRPLAVSSVERAQAYPDVPSFSDYGYGDASFSIFLGLFAPAGIPDGIRQSIAEAVEVAREDDVLLDRMAGMGYVLSDIGSEEFDGFIRQESDRYKPLVEGAGIDLSQ
ncbi:Bug family tripartite tricarboxylate transporter substrate binding protein [Halomonas sp. HK25]|uniref:Bug family tripartite tricarboxylate transporter substrate binding protein n=1 Tax=Halomonas sp. HK25 TaxID=3394321 RepID=UPI0039FC8D53